MIETVFRAVRGGSRVKIPVNLRAAYRGFNTPARRNKNLGFRLVVRIKEKEE